MLKWIINKTNKQQNIQLELELKQMMSYKSFFVVNKSLKRYFVWVLIFASEHLNVNAFAL